MTLLLLHPSEKRNDKWLPYLLAFNSCHAYMVNPKKIFLKNFREKEPPVVFHKENWSKILDAILGMKTIYCRKHNIKLVNPKKLSGK